MEAKPTAGDWKIARGSCKIPAPSEDFYRIETVYDHIAYVRAEHPEGKANARLIAAAPTMHQKLTDTVAWLDREIERARMDNEVNLEVGFRIERLKKLRDDLAETLRKIGEGVWKSLKDHGRSSAKVLPDL